jgi:hypothetical protein
MPSHAQRQNPNNADEEFYHSPAFLSQRRQNRASKRNEIGRKPDAAPCTLTSGKAAILNYVSLRNIPSWNETASTP